MTIFAHTDGAARGNPGESGIGFILKDESGKVLHEGFGYIGTATNNVAEYAALLACIRKAAEIGCDRLVVHSDSELMVKQMRGEYRVKDKGLLEYYLRVKELLNASPFTFEILAIARENNRVADHLANIGIDSKSGQIDVY
jgi:ribonuclease HI